MMPNELVLAVEAMEKTVKTVLEQAAVIHTNDMDHLRDDVRTSRGLIQVLSLTVERMARLIDGDGGNSLVVRLDRIEQSLEAGREDKQARSKARLALWLAVLGFFASLVVAVATRFMR